LEWTKFFGHISFVNKTYNSMKKAMLFSWLALLTISMFLFSCDPSDPPDPVDDDGVVIDPPNDTIPVIGTNESVLTVRPADFAGFVPNERHVASEHIPSPYRIETPELDYKPQEPEKEEGVFVITENLSGWHEVPLEDEKYFLFLVTPGNYTKWGVIPMTVFGTPAKRKVIRYYNPDLPDPYESDHPYHQYFGSASSDPAIMEGILCGKKGPGVKLGAGYWTVYGLTFAGNQWAIKGITAGSGVTMWPGSSDLRIIKTLWYRWRGGRMTGDDWYWCDNVAIGRLFIRGDHAALGNYAYHENSYNARILDSEFWDGADLFGAPKDGEGSEEFAHVNGMIVDGNTFAYSDSVRVDFGDGQTYNCGGDAFDLKNGSDDPNNPVIISNNVILNVFPTPPDKSCGDNTGSIGVTFLVHKDGSYIITKDNVAKRGSVAIRTSPGHRKGMYCHHLAYLNNLFQDYPGAATIENVGHFIQPNAPHTSAVFNTAMGFSSMFGIQSKFKDSTIILANRYEGPEGDLPQTKGNVIFEGNAMNPKTEFGPLEVVCRPITGPEVIVFEDAVLHVKDGGLDYQTHETPRTDDYWWSAFVDPTIENVNSMPRAANGMVLMNGK
jgi:hypothetical protein